MGKSSSAPEYAQNKVDSKYWGSSTTNKNGTTFDDSGSSSWMGDTMGTVGSNLNKTLNSTLSGDYANDPNYQVYQNNLNRQMSQNYDANVLSPLANRGLMRSSGLQAATNSFANTLADNTADLYDSYYNRQQNNLNNLFNTSNTLYNYMTGLGGMSQQGAQNVSNYNMSAWQQEQANKQAMFNSIMSTVGDIAGAAGSVGSAAVLASNINVKENIKKIGEKNCFNWYEFTYKNGYGLPKGRQEGVIAQEVEKIKPEAVIEINGIKHVDYSKI